MDYRFSLDEKIAQRKTHLFPNNIPYYEHPIQLVRAKGCRVWDSTGREYLDAFGGVVTISLGHNHPRIKNKLRAMLDADEIQHTTPLYFHSYLEELAEKLLALTPGPLQRAYITNSGSEANELALLAARLFTGEQVIVALGHAYHGGTAATLSLCGNYRWKFTGQANHGVSHALAPYCYRCPFGARPQSCNLECADDVKRVVETTSSGKVAGIIVETIMGVGGVIDPPPAYHKRVYELIKQYGGVYIADEVQSGIGRAGKHFFAIAESELTPDMITTAKGLGNGAPIAALLSSEACAQAMAGKVHFNTFAGDPYQTMQAGVVVEEAGAPAFIAAVDQVGRQLKAGLQALAEEFPCIGEVRGRGLMLGLELVEDKRSKAPAAAACEHLLNLCKEQQLLVGKGGLYANVIRLAPPLSITSSEVDELLTKLRGALSRLP